jgi:hypothetical protein
VTHAASVVHLLAVRGGLSVHLTLESILSNRLDRKLQIKPKLVKLNFAITTLHERLLKTLKFTKMIILHNTHINKFVLF